MGALGALPFVWMSADLMDDMEKTIRMCASQGVDCVEVPSWSVTGCARHLAVLRKHGVKGFTSCGYDPSEDARPAVRQGRPCERAVFTGGAYRGLAIDRNLFTFDAGPHEIVVEPPVYSGRQPYVRTAKDADGTAVRSGHYFANVRPTGRAEIIVPERPFDGAPHVQTIPCEVLPARPGDTPENDTAAGMSGPEIENRRLVRLKFDLTGCDGYLLDKVGIAVYWESDPDGESWRKGFGQLSVFSEHTRRQARELGKRRAQMWADANGGAFPSNEIVAIRFGDECFNITGWADAPACSFPLWGFSESGRAAFERRAEALRSDKEALRSDKEALRSDNGALRSDKEALRSDGMPLQPRTWGFPEIYGEEAYAIALHEYHRACAALVRAFREGVREVSPDLLVFRNTTRGGVWTEANDHDGTGQELLARELDFLHLDPYPMCADGYDAEYIPRDMGYLAGLARRCGKPLVPWMQAHAYTPTGLGHVTPGDMRRMWAQHEPFSPDAIVWLGFGSADDPLRHVRMTFPHGSPESWAYAKEFFATLHADRKARAEGRASDTPPPAPLAVVRPYSTRAICCSLGDGRWRNPADRILEAWALAWGVDNGLPFDVFELPPDPVELSRYKAVVSTIPLPGVANVRILGEGTEGSVLASAELGAMRKAFAAEIAADSSPSPRTGPK